MTQEELEARCAGWQKRLRLQDWKVKLERKRYVEMSNEAIGRCEMMDTYKEATISVVPPEDFPEDWDDYRDWEHTLVHELLEIHFGRFKPKSGKSEHEDAEIAINLIAAALVALERERQALEEKE